MKIENLHKQNACKPFWIKKNLGFDKIKVCIYDMYEVLFYGSFIEKLRMKIKSIDNYHNCSLIEGEG